MWSEDNIEGTNKNVTIIKKNEELLIHKLFVTRYIICSLEKDCFGLLFHLKNLLQTNTDNLFWENVTDEFILVMYGH